MYELDQVPPHVSQEVTKRGCTLPKLGYRNIKSGIIKGNFSDQTKDDYAFLCKKGEYSKVVIVWSEGSPCESEIHREEDSYFYNKRKNGLYSRNLRSIKTNRVIETLEREKRNKGKLKFVPVEATIENGKKKFTKINIYGGDLSKEKEKNSKIDLKTLKHDGIADAYLDRGTIITFCYQGQWHKTRGATQ